MPGTTRKKSAKKAVKKKIVRGIRMTKGSSWRLRPTKGKEREFAGTLLGTFNMGTKRIAVFSVPNR
jgi:hypothetical protein